LFFARFLVGVRSPVYLTAGILKFPFRRFIITDFFCALFVILLFVGLSYYWGQDLVNYIRKVEHGLTVVLLVAAVPIAIFLWIHYRRKKKPTSPGMLGTLLGEDAASMKMENGNTIPNDNDSN
jgi:membrane protein DedA with SNARE-associated domain